MKNKTKSIFKLNKLFELISTIIIVSLLSFLLMKISPVDPAEAYARRNFVSMSEESLNELREGMGLNKPLPVQYFDWVKNALSLDFGKSYVSGRDVFTDVISATSVTGAVVLISTLIQAVGALIIGVLLYKFHKNLFGKILNILCIVSIAIPGFLLAGAFIDIFAVKYRWMNVATNIGIVRYLPPAICMSISGIGFFGQLLSQAIENNMMEDYVQYSRCRGLSENRIILKHALPKALIGLLPNFMQMMGLCMGGSIIIESIFSLPGLGYSIMTSVLYRDAPMIHATILSLGISLVFFNVLSEIFKTKIRRS